MSNLPKIKIDTVEVTTLSEAITFYRGNQSELARAINMNRGTLRNRLKSKEGLATVLKVIRDPHSHIMGFEWVNKHNYNSED